MNAVSGMCFVSKAVRFAMLQLLGSGPISHKMGVVRTVGPSALPDTVYLWRSSSALTSLFCFIHLTELEHETLNSARKSTAPALLPKFCPGYLTLKRYALAAVFVAGKLDHKQIGLFVVSFSSLGKMCS